MVIYLSNYLWRGTPIIRGQIYYISQHGGTGTFRKDSPLLQQLLPIQHTRVRIALQLQVLHREHHHEIGRGLAHRGQFTLTGNRRIAKRRRHHQGSLELQPF